MMDAPRDKQRFEMLEAPYLLSKVADLKDEGYRLVQICAMDLDEGCRLAYSFDRGEELISYGLDLKADENVESITRIYWPAFIYENEINSIYGINFKHSRLDYAGTFMKLRKEDDVDSDADEGGEEQS